LLTVEDLKTETGEMHPAQRALVDCHGSQCGFCTPGFAMSLFALYHDETAPSRDRINDVLAGNLCRCTDYRPIVDAARHMYELPPDDAWQRREPEILARLRTFDHGTVPALEYEGRRWF